VGRALRSSDDCSYHSWFVMKYGIVVCEIMGFEQLYAGLRLSTCGAWLGQLLAGLPGAGESSSPLKCNLLENLPAFSQFITLLNLGLSQYGANVVA
jgi:hypothetical protein